MQIELPEESQQLRHGSMSSASGSGRALLLRRTLIRSLFILRLRSVYTVRVKYRPISPNFMHPKTSSPTCSSATPLPTAATVPETSNPNFTGNLSLSVQFIHKFDIRLRKKKGELRTHGSVIAILNSPLASSISAGLILAACTFTST